MPSTVRSLTLTATLIAMSAGAAGTGVASAQTIEWAEAESGFWLDATNWNPQNVPDEMDETAVLGLKGPYASWLHASLSIASLEIPNPEAVFSLLDGMELQIHQHLTTNGAVIVNPGGTPATTRIRFNQSHTIEGDGEIFLNAHRENTNTAYLEAIGNAVITFSPDLVVRGIGRLYGCYILEGAIRCDDPFGGVIQINGGLVRAANAGRVELDGGGLQLNGATLESVPVFAAGDEMVEVVGSSTIRDVALGADLAIMAGHALSLDGVNTLDGSSIIVNATGGNSGTLLQFDATSPFGGTGNVVLNANFANYGTARLETLKNEVATIGSGLTVRGVGRIQGRYMLDGSIVCDGPEGESIQLYGSAIEGSGPGAIELRSGNLFALLSAVVDGVPITSTGAGRVVAGTSTFKDVVFDTDVDVLSGNALQVDGGVILNGRLVVNSTGGNSGTALVFTRTDTLDGVGEVVLNANFANYGTGRLETVNNHVATIGSGLTVRGVGRIQGRYVLDGSIVSDGPEDESIQLYGCEIEGTGTGAIELRSGNLFALLSAVVEGVPITSTGAGRVVAGTSTFNDVVFDTDVEIPSGNGVSLDGETVLNGRLIVNTTGGNSGTAVTFRQTDTLDGVGEIVLNANLANYGTARLETLDNHVTTLNPEIELRGTGFLDGRLVVEGAVAPETPGVTQIGELAARTSLTFAPTALLDVEINDLDAHDRIGGSGQKFLGGTLRRITGSYVPQSGDTLTIVSGGPVSGAFDALDLAAGWRVEYDATAVRLTFGCRADVDGDGLVGFGDVVAVLAAWGACPDCPADVDGDGMVGFSDLLIVLTDWGACSG